MMTAHDCHEIATMLDTLADAIDSGNPGALARHARESASLCRDRDPLMGQLVQAHVGLSLVLPGDPRVSLRAFARAFEEAANG